MDMIYPGTFYLASLHTGVTIAASHVCMLPFPQELYQWAKFAGMLEVKTSLFKITRFCNECLKSVASTRYDDREYELLRSRSWYCSTLCSMLM